MFGQNRLLLSSRGGHDPRSRQLTYPVSWPSDKFKERHQAIFTPMSVKDFHLSVRLRHRRNGVCASLPPSCHHVEAWTKPKKWEWSWTWNKIKVWWQHLSSGIKLLLWWAYPPGFFSRINQQIPLLSWNHMKSCFLWLLSKVVLISTHTLTLLILKLSHKVNNIITLHKWGH